MRKALAGKVAIVTGVSGELGRTCALRLADEGAFVIAASPQVDLADQVAREIATVGGRSVGVEVETTDSASVDRLVERTLAIAAGLDILINAPETAVVRDGGLAESAWDDILATRLKALWLCARTCATPMRRAGRGRIVNLSTSAFLRPTQEGEAAHLAAAAAVVGLTRALAREVGSDNVTVNAVCPGPLIQLGDQVAPAALADQALPRRGTFADVAGVVLFLASDGAAWITGQTINVDGGWTLH